MLRAECENLPLYESALDVVILEDDIFLQALHGVVVLGVPELG